MWSKNESFAINFKNFAEQYLKEGKYFKTTNEKSFIRQLHLYGFKKFKFNQKKASDKEELVQNFKFSSVSYKLYHHQYFKPGRKDLLKLFKRNRVVKNGTAAAEEDKENSENNVNSTP